MSEDIGADSLVEQPNQQLVLADQTLDAPIQTSRSIQIGLWTWLLGPVFILILSSLLVVVEDRAVRLPGLPVLPETCAMKARMGIDCPGCGLTRSFSYIAHGNFTGAWRLNRLSFIVFAFTVLQIPLASLHLLGISKPWITKWTRLNERSLVGVILLLFAWWTLRLLTGDLFP